MPFVLHPASSSVSHRARGKWTVFIALCSSSLTTQRAVTSSPCALISNSFAHQKRTARARTDALRFAGRQVDVKPERSHMIRLEKLQPQPAPSDRLISSSGNDPSGDLQSTFIEYLTGESPRHKVMASARFPSK